jgi:hypothetical protein
MVKFSVRIITHHPMKPLHLPPISYTSTTRGKRREEKKKSLENNDFRTEESTTDLLKMAPPLDI